MGGRRLRLIWPHNPTANSPPKYRRACQYDAFIPDALSGQPLHLDARVAGVVADAEAAIRELNAVARPALAPLARLLLRTESIASSKVEGIQVGVHELARAEGRAESGGRVGATAREILANIDAMELAVHEAAAAQPFSVREIRAIHARLMTQSNAQIAGRIRAVQNWIGGNDYNPCGADFVPPPPEHMAEMLDDLCEAINDDLLPPLVQAALVHAQFETIHPFEDGNGRAGRALIHVVLHRRGIARDYVPPISVVLARARGRYIAGLTSFRGDDVEGWIEQFAAASGTAARLARAYLQAVTSLGAQWRAQLADSTSAPRADAAAWALIDTLPAHPIITAPVAAAATTRSRPQIYQALSQLESAGVLIPLSSGRRNQSWEAAGLLDLLARFEAGDQP